MRWRSQSSSRTSRRSEPRWRSTSSPTRPTATSTSPSSSPTTGAAAATTTVLSLSFYIRYSFNDVNNPNRNRMGIQERFSQTDRALEEVPTWPNVSVTTPDWTIMSSTERASSNLTDRQISNRPSQISAGHSRGGPVRGLQIQAEIPNPA